MELAPETNGSAIVPPGAAIEFEQPSFGLIAEQANASIEQEPTPDLYNELGDEMVSFLGFKGRLKDLGPYCPVDLNDPRITIDMKNDFVVKGLNASGSEINPKYADIFAKTTEKLGLDKNYTVAEPTKAPTAEKTPDSPIAEVKQVKQSAQPETVETVPPAKPLEVVATELVDGDELQIRQTVSELEEVLQVAKNLTEVIDTPSKAEKPELGLVPTDVVELAPKPRLLAPDIAEKLVSSQTEAPKPEIVDIESLVELFAMTEAFEPVIADDAEITAETEPVYDLAGFVEDEWIEPVNTAEHVAEIDAPLSSEAVVVELVDWAAELEKSPDEVLEDFTQALLLFAELSLAPPSDAPETIDFATGQLNIVETSEAQPLAPIVATVAERLSELEAEDKLIVAPILKDIVGAIHGLQLLEARNADPEIITAVTTQLEELCISLFEAIGIDYDEADVKRFIEVMLHPDFQPPQPEVEELDLEHMGTREVKRNFQLFNSSLDDIEFQLQQVLGMFALLCARGVDSRMLAA